MPHHLMAVVHEGKEPQSASQQGDAGLRRTHMAGVEQAVGGGRNGADAGMSLFGPPALLDPPRLQLRHQRRGGHVRLRPRRARCRRLHKGGALQQVLEHAIDHGGLLPKNKVGAVKEQERGAQPPRQLGAVPGGGHDVVPAVDDQAGHARAADGPTLLLAEAVPPDGLQLALNEGDVFSGWKG